MAPTTNRRATGGARSVVLPVVMTVLALAAGACGPGGASSAPAAPVPAASLAWKPCGTQRCATLTVPLDATDPASTTVDLALVEQPAGDPDRRIGTLLVNPGGPGASGTDFVRGGFGTGALRDRFDVVGWDPRGVGQSRPSACEGVSMTAFEHLDSGPDDDGEQRQLDDGARAVADGCGRADAALAAHMDTATAAADVDRIRQALGEDQLSFLLFSYGTAIGEQYAERFPTRVRAMVLDGVVDPTQDLEATLTDQATSLQRSVDQLFASCNADDGCAVRDPAGVLGRLAAHVEDDPLPNDHGGQVGPSEVALAVVQSSYTQRDGQRLLRALADADQGDGTAMGQLAADYTSGADERAYLSVSCTDTPHPDADGFHRLAARLRAISPVAGPAVANELLPCAFWPAPVTGSTSPVHAAGSGPVVLLGNTGDAATPVANADRAGAALEQGHLVIYTGTGHTSYDQSGCARDVVDAFLVDLTIPPDHLTCSS